MWGHQSSACLACASHASRPPGLPDCVPKSPDSLPAPLLARLPAAAFLFFVAFVVVCAYTLLNLYVGVIFNQFSRIRTLSQTGSAFLTGKQQVGAGLPSNLGTPPSACHRS
jgi:hypothetical protein